MERSNTIANWLQEFKIAIIKKEYEHIDILLNTLPSFTSLDQMHEAQALINEAIHIFDQRKRQLIQSMKKNRQTKKYVQG